MSSPVDNTTDLQLLSFRYVAGEMDEAESQLFEARLAEDQTAREAVAEMVQLSTAVHLTCVDAGAAAASSQVQSSVSLNSVPARRRRVSPLWLLGTVAAICLSFLLGFFSHPDQQVVEHLNSQPSGSQVPPASSSAASEEALSVLQAFNQLRQPENLDQIIAGIDPESGSLQESAGESESPASGDESLDVPTWMFAAIEAQPDGDPLQPQNEIQEN